jgi:hypothetical protein
MAALTGPTVQQEDFPVGPLSFPPILLRRPPLSIPIGPEQFAMATIVCLSDTPIKVAGRHPHAPIQRTIFVGPASDMSFSHKHLLEHSILFQIQTVGWQAHCSSRIRICILPNVGKDIVIHFPQPSVARQGRIKISQTTMSRSYPTIAPHVLALPPLSPLCISLVWLTR